jgi:polysaccharide export outer membrane protein
MMGFLKALTTMFAAAALLAAPWCALAEPGAAVQPAAAQPAATKAVDSASYTLGTGDKVRVIVFGETDLSGEFVVDDSGFVRLPLIGQIAAGGRTVRELENDIAAKLGAEYLREPRVSIEVLSHRPFYIMGEVNRPGEYPYVAGMSVLNAVALGGGYTYRANRISVSIRRKGAENDEEKSYPADDTTKLMPGDVVNVAERWF